MSTHLNKGKAQFSSCPRLVVKAGPWSRIAQKLEFSQLIGRGESHLEPCFCKKNLQYGFRAIFDFIFLVCKKSVLLWKICLTDFWGSIMVWRFKPILSVGLRFHSHLSGGLWLRNYCAVAGNHKFSSRFSVFACFCGVYSNRVMRLRRLSGNFILLKASLFKGDSFLTL